jgi:ABC-type dipeptide/oligopeptide/nickel transport system permease component
MRRAFETLLTALVLSFATHLMLVAGRTPADAEAVRRAGPAEAVVSSGLPVEEPDPMRAELLRAIQRDLRRPGLRQAGPARPEPSGRPTEAPASDGRPTAEAWPGAPISALELAEYWNWLRGLPGELLSFQEAGATRRFLRTLAAFGLAAVVWLLGSMGGLFAGVWSLRRERRILAGALLLASCLPVFCLAALGYGSVVLAGVGAGILGGLLADGFLGVRALARPLPGYLRAAYGSGARWLFGGAGEQESWRWRLRGLPRALRGSLERHLLRPQLAPLLFLLRSRLPLLLGGVLVAELALDLQGLSRTFNSFDQAAQHGSFLTGVLLCFGLIRLASWLVRGLEVRLDPVLAHRPAWDAGHREPLEHQPSFSLLRPDERRWAVAAAAGAVAVGAGQGWLAALLLVVALGWTRLGEALRSLGWEGTLGVALCSPLLLLPLAPPQMLEGSPLLAGLASCGRRCVVAVLAVLASLRPILAAELRGGVARRAVDAVAYGLESLPQVLAAVILLRLGAAGLERLWIDSPLVQEALAGLVYGLFGIAFLLRAVVEPLGSVRQRRHVRCSRALGLSDREVLSELFGGRMRRRVAALAALVASMALLLDLYVGFVFERTLTTGGGYGTALGQLLGREDLGWSRGAALAAAVLALAGLQLLRGALEEAEP